ncbi:MAG: PIN domain nuclease, partial [Chloroflexota bacterium]
MQLSTDFIFRIIGAIVFTVIFALLGIQLAPAFEGSSETFGLIFGLLGFLFGLILTPSLTIYPLRRVSKRLSNMAPEHLVAIIAGIFLGLMAAALLSLPLGFLPSPFRQIMP